MFGRFVPEFGRVVALMQFNMYHHYTVDEHLIRAVGNVAAIERGEHKHDHPLSTEIIKRIKSRETLYCAMLLHDIAKGCRAIIPTWARRSRSSLCPRWGLSPGDTEDVAWLVKNHLLMSDVAQRRDIADPKTVRDFVEAVQTPEMLRSAGRLDRRRYPRRRPRRVERLEGPAPARALLRGRSDDDRRRHQRRRAPRASAAPRHALEERLADLAPKRRARARSRAITTPIGWPSIPTRRNAMPG